MLRPGPKYPRGHFDPARNFPAELSPSCSQLFQPEEIDHAHREPVREQ
jgi:hypothetical protein